MNRYVSSRGVPTATQIALGACLACSSPSDSASTASPAPFEGMPGGAGAAGTLPTEPVAGGTPLAPPGSEASPLPSSGPPPQQSAEALMPMNLAPAAAPQGVAAPSGPLCSAKLRVQGPRIADFESYDGTQEPTAFTFRFGMNLPNSGVLAGVFAFDDMTGASSRFGILSGRTGGWGASHQIIGANAWGGGMGFWFDCVDASAFSGISLWVRGSTVPGTFSVTANFLRTSAANAADPRAGTCTGGAELCRNPSLDGIPLTLDWTRIEIPWSSFTPGLVNGAAFVPTGDELMGLNFGLPIGWGPDPSFVDNPNDMTDMPAFLPLPSDIIFQVDDIDFLAARGGAR